MQTFQRKRRRDEDLIGKPACTTVASMSNMRSSLLARLPIVKQGGKRMFSARSSLQSFSPLEISGPLESLGYSRRAILWPAMEADLGFMQIALDEARAAAIAGEVPVGAVLVHDAKVIARSGNRTIRDTDPSAHAEIVVLREAARTLGNYRLAGTTLYVTIEPCSMCAGAMVQARVPRLVYGCDDPKGGAVRSVFQILSDPRLNHQVQITPGILAAECAAVIQAFFAARR
jgi:tRNA(adenine34) deaminase